MQVNVGDIVDDLFRVTKYLGAGASGKVYLVSLEKDWQTYKKGTQFALKAYNDEIFKKEEEAIVFERRKREATIGNRVKSKNVLKTYDTSAFWRDGDKPDYLLMELIDGTQLDDWVKANSPLPIRDVYLISLQIASALKALHSAGIIHRDVKAPNVLITASKRVVLLDLGVVRPLAEDTITGRESFLGTLRYAAPEWLIDTKCSEAADVYSLGTIIYLLLHGHEIFSEIDLFSRLVLAVYRDNPEVAVLNVDPERAFLGDVCLQLLAKKPKKRISLAMVIQFLEKKSGSDLWARIRQERILEFFPSLKNYPETEPTLETLFTGVDENNLDLALAQKDRSILDSLLGNDRIKFEIENLKRDSSEYLKLSEKERIAWVRKAFAMMDANSGWDDPSNIENKALLASRIKEVEKSPQVLQGIRGVLWEVETDMNGMIKIFKQENP